MVLVLQNVGKATLRSKNIKKQNCFWDATVNIFWPTSVKIVCYTTGRERGISLGKWEIKFIEKSLYRPCWTKVQDFKEQVLEFQLCIQHWASYLGTYNSTGHNITIFILNNQTTHISKKPSKPHKTNLTL